MLPKEPNNPLVSIVVPCYNHESYIQDCITSIINQDYADIELIVIDDGSSDKSVEKIQSMIPACQKRFVRFEFRHRKNLGLSSTLNEGLEWCEGEYYFSTASDDVLLDKKTSLLVNVMQKDKRIVGAFGSMLLIDDANKDIGQALVLEGIHTFNDIIMNESVPGAPASFFRRSSILNLGGYPKNIKMEDWYMWLKLTENGDLLRSVRSPVVKYRLHNTNTAKNYRLMHEQRLMILSEYSTHALYKKALSRAYLVSASQSSSFSDFFFTVEMLMKAKDEKISTRIKYFIKALTPAIFIKLLKNII